jgi:hypothetical protein
MPHNLSGLIKLLGKRYGVFAYPPKIPKSIGISALRTRCLTIRNASVKWTMPIRAWKRALTQFAKHLIKEF